MKQLQLKPEDILQFFSCIGDDGCLGDVVVVSSVGDQTGMIATASKHFLGQPHISTV